MSRMFAADAEPANNNVTDRRNQATNRGAAGRMPLACHELNP